MTTEELTRYFKGVKKNGNGFKAICPCHSDKKASLSITPGTKKPLIKCHAGCDYNDILNAIGLKPQDVYYEDRPLQNSLKKYQYFIEQRQGKKIEAEYHYRFICNGEYAFTKIRLQGKDLVYGILENDRFNYGLPKSRTEMKAYYGASKDKLKAAISNGDYIFIPEGEKDVDNLLKRGYIAFTYGGTQDWNKYFLPLVDGAKVIILADNDKPGKEVAERIKKDVLTVATEVYIIVPSDKDKGDISDYFQEGHTTDDFNKLIEKTVTKKSVDLLQFTRSNRDGIPTAVSDESIYRYIKKNYNLFVCGSIPYIYKGGRYYPDYSGAALKTIIQSLIPEGYNLIKSTTNNRIFELFIQDKGLHKSFDELNQYPSHWICFRNGMYDCKSGEMIPHNPKYLCINQIPHSYFNGFYDKGEKIDSYLDFITESPDEKEMLLQYIGLCLTVDTTQQKFLVLNGTGGSGKSTFIRLVESLIGSENVSNVSLKDLEQRFSVIGLMNKLLNSCADLQIEALEDTSVLKKLLGEDTLRAEPKGKDSFSFKSYAKLIFSTNELPLIKSEKTNGFYRRLLIHTMNRTPETINPNFFDELLQEQSYLLELSVKALERLYKQGTITISKSSDESVKQLRRDSDTVQDFIDNECDTSVKTARCERGYLFNKYLQFCKDIDRTPVTRNNFYKSLRAKQFGEVKSNGDYYFTGLILNKNIPKSPLQTTLDTTEEPIIDNFPFTRPN